MTTQLRNLRTNGLICLALGLTAFALYLPTLRHEFIAYDDQQYVTENLHVRAGLTGPGLVWAFGYRAGNWHPLTWLSHMLDCQVYGLNPAGHHLTNMLLHAANTVLLFLALRCMTGAVWRSACVAALFAWHPLHVESVAWVAERKDVLSAFFFLLTLWIYGLYVEKSAGVSKLEAVSSHAPRVTHHALRYYLLSLLFFILGLMSKPMVVTLPFVLLLLDYWPLRRRAGCGVRSAELRDPEGQRIPVGWRRLVVEKIPFLALSAVACLLTLAAQQPAVVSTRGLPIFQRVEHTLVSYAHYLGALLVPRRMAIYYPYQKAIPMTEVLLAGVLLVLITGVVFRLASRRSYLVTGWLWFLGMLVPVIGLVQVGDQAWADRYTYLPSVGLFMAVVWGFGEWVSERSCRLPRPKDPTGLELSAPARLGGASGSAVGGLAVVVAAGLLVGTTLQLRYWKDTRTLFEHASQVTRDNPLALSLLGSLLAKEGKLDQAINYYRKALQIEPRFPEAQFCLANALDQQGQLDEAIELYQKALWFKPSQTQSHIFLGAAFAKQRKYEEAATHYRAALALNPESAIAHNNLARLLHTQGRLDEAIVHYSAALKLDPSLAQAHNNLGVLFLQKGRVAEGTAQFREALRLKPEDLESQLNLAQALAEQEQWAEAAEFFGRTVTSATADPNAHCQYAVALAHLQKTREAMSHYASALLLQPDLPTALDGLSWIAATAADPQLRDGTEAVRMASRACELTGRKDPVKLKTLAAAYAEVGQFPEATAAVQHAYDLAKQAGREPLAKECRLMLDQFKESKPWRQSREP